MSSLFHQVGQSAELPCAVVRAAHLIPYPPPTRGHSLWACTVILSLYSVDAHISLLSSTHKGCRGRYDMPDEYWAAVLLVHPCCISRS